MKRTENPLKYKIIFLLSIFAKIIHAAGRGARLPRNGISKAGSPKKRKRKVHRLDRAHIVSEPSGGPEASGASEGLKCVDLDLWEKAGKNYPAFTLTSLGLRIEGSEKEFKHLQKMLSQ